jgi:predicted MFS family arabinose efflux permease
VAQGSLTQWQSAALTTAVQLGFVVGAVTSALLTLPDRVDPARLVPAAALVAGVATAALPLSARYPAVVVLLRFLTGAGLAGVYPIAIRVVSSWYDRRRASAVAVLVAALTLGSSLPQLVGGLLVSRWQPSLLTAGLLCAGGGALLGRRIRCGPYAVVTARARRAEVRQLLRQRQARSTLIAYAGHMWELYALWTWMPTLALAALGAHGTSWEPGRVRLLCFLAIGPCGALGCLVVGRIARRTGELRAAVAVCLVSATCCIATATAFGAGPVVLVPVLCVWGAAAVADSALFSSTLTRLVDPHLVGTAVTAQTASGYLVTVAAIHSVPLAAQAGGWPIAVALLALGPAASLTALTRLLRRSESPTPTNDHYPRRPS